MFQVLLTLLLSISWVLQNTTADEPSSFDVECFRSAQYSNVSEWSKLHHIFSRSSPNCCVSAVYELYVADGICTEIETPKLFVKRIIQCPILNPKI